MIVGERKKHLYLCAFIILTAFNPLHGNELVWSGEVVISTTMELPEGAKLVIKPGAKIRFEEKGRLVLRKGEIVAMEASFSASKPLESLSRIDGWKTNTYFNECVFDGLVTTKKRFHNAAISFFYGTHCFDKNRFRNCSPVELIHCAKPIFKRNQFDLGTSGIVLFHCLDGRVMNNEFRSCGGNAIHLNNSDKVTVLENRFFSVACALSLYGKSSKNKMIGNSIFDSQCGVRMFGVPVENSILTTLCDKTGIGLDVQGCGVGNVLSNAVFWRCSTALWAKNIHPTAFLTIQNSVIGKSKIGVNCSTNNLVLKNNLFFDNKDDTKVASGLNFKAVGTIEVDPMFKNPEEGDFRLKTNSPISGSGIVGMGNIGLFPPVNNRRVVVDRDGTGDFTEIGKAIASIKDATEDNPVDIVIKPGVYNETLETVNWVNLIGEDREKCVIRYDGGPDDTVHKHTIWATSNTTIKNLTLIGGEVKYVIHSDRGGIYELKIENCTLRREYPNKRSRNYFAAFGIGLNGGQRILVRGCLLEAIVPIYWHNWNNQKLPCEMIVENCSLIGEDYAIKICNLGSGQKDLFILRNCVLEGREGAISYGNLKNIPNTTWNGQNETTLVGCGNKLGMVVGTTIIDER